MPIGARRSRRWRFGIKRHVTKECGRPRLRRAPGLGKRRRRGGGGPTAHAGNPNGFPSGARARFSPAMCGNRPGPCPRNPMCHRAFCHSDVLTLMRGEGRCRERACLYGDTPCAPSFCARSRQTGVLAEDAVDLAAGVLKVPAESTGGALRGRAEIVGGTRQLPIGHLPISDIMSGKVLRFHSELSCHAGI